MRPNLCKSSTLVQIGKSVLSGLAIGSLSLFIGAARPATPRKISIPTMPRPTRMVFFESTAIDALSGESQDVELLHEARPAVASFNSSSSILSPLPRGSRVLRMEVTAYCACTKCCGPDAQGITASGMDVSHNGGKFVAADTDLLPMFTKLVVPGYDCEPVPIIDRGGAIKGYKLDVYFPTHEEALEWGRRWVDVTVVGE